MKTDSPLLRIGAPSDLARFVANQLDHLFPCGHPSTDIEQLMFVMPNALDRMRLILAAVHAFDPTMFDHFNSLQYATLLYLLANESWRRQSVDSLADRLFCLNRALNSIDLFYAVKMPQVFFISHGLGSVLGNVTYGDRLVIFQNVTVGRVGQDKPVIGNGVVLYPGATVTGRSIVGDNCVLAAGTIVHNRIVPEDMIASMRGGDLIFRPRSRDYSGLYLRQQS